MVVRSRIVMQTGECNKSIEWGKGRGRVRGVFFFQAEDGIRGWSVTGVQTCALPILKVGGPVTKINSELSDDSKLQV